MYCARMILLANTCNRPNFSTYCQNVTKTYLVLVFNPQRFKQHHIYEDNHRLPHPNHQHSTPIPALFAVFTTSNFIDHPVIRRFARLPGILLIL